MRHRDQFERLAGDPSLARSATDELLRYDSPVQVTARAATADTEVGSQPIRQGEQVVLSLAGANRDPARFSEPDVFDVARTDTQHLGFGHGIHFCLGAALSRLESAAMLGALIALPGLALDRDALGGGAPTYVANLAARGLQSLPIRFEPG